MPAEELDAPYPLDDATIRCFREDGFVRLSGVFSPQLINDYAPEIDRMVAERNPLKDVPLEQRSLYDQAFIQVSNVWPHSEKTRELAFSKRLARIAAELMGTRGVRMWHDQALYKEPSGGFTPWHVDQQYWPMASPHSVTAWIPLQDTPMEMGPLCFGRGSHRKHIGRDLEISAESEEQIREAVRKEKIDRSAGAVRAGRRELPPRLDTAPRRPQHHQPAASRLHHHLHGFRHAAGEPQEQEPTARLGHLDPEHARSAKSWTTRSIRFFTSLETRLLQLLQLVRFV